LETTNEHFWNVDSRALRTKIVLCISGYDPTGGAGLLADTVALAGLGIRTAGAITALTIQGPARTVRFSPVEPKFFAETLAALTADLPISAVKIGMLGSGENVRIVRDFLRRRPKNVPVVIDPVLTAGAGGALGDEDVFAVLRDELTAQATLIAPNVPEAERLCNLSIKQPFECERAAQRLREMGAGNVLIKGGHLDGDPVDRLWTTDGFFEWKNQRKEGAEVHGTGCALAALIAGLLAQEKPMDEAVGTAIETLQQAISSAWSPTNEGWRFSGLVG